MKYVEVNFVFEPNTQLVSDVLAHQLAEIDYESFVSSKSGLLAYVQENKFSEEKIEHLRANFLLDAEIDYKFTVIEDKNWNQEWEKNYFKPIVIDNKCIIHSSFHEIEDNYDYRILIDPKMSFGTGHHQTTTLILREILNMDLQNKQVLDMGCGTGVLAILAALRGADEITAIDNDEWAYNNALENISLNNISNIQVKLGGAELLRTETFDVILANINRNILLQDIPHYAKILKPNGKLILSGFYKEDIPVICQKCEENSLKFSHFTEIDRWVAVCVEA